MLPLGKGKVKENIYLILFGFSDSTSRQSARYPISRAGTAYFIYQGAGL
jgi:hypothetical protein